MDFLLHALNVESQEVQAIAAVGIAKLMLSGMLTDEEVGIYYIEHSGFTVLNKHLHSGLEATRACLLCSRDC